MRLQSLKVPTMTGQVETGYAEDQQVYMVIYQRGAPIWQRFAEVVRSPARCSWLGCSCAFRPFRRALLCCLCPRSS